MQKNKPTDQLSNFLLLLHGIQRRLVTQALWTAEDAAICEKVSLLLESLVDSKEAHMNSAAAVRYAKNNAKNLCAPEFVTARAALYNALWYYITEIQIQLREQSKRKH